MFHENVVSSVKQVQIAQYLIIFVDALSLRIIRALTNTTFDFNQNVLVNVEINFNSD